MAVYCNVLTSVLLANGEEEILGTTLLDKQKYPQEEFKWLYHMRWGIETYFDRLKNIFEIERFSGQKMLSLEQDFKSRVFLSNLESILIKQSQQELTRQTSHCHNAYKINHSMSYFIASSYFIECLTQSTFELRKTLKTMNGILKLNPVIVKPKRNFPRKKRTPSQKFRYLKYDKRLVA